MGRVGSSLGSRQLRPVPLLLAGGASARMGRDKRLLRVGGVTLIRRAYDALERALGAPWVLVADAASREAIAHELPLAAHFVSDEAPACGPAVALAGALRRAQQDYVFLLACDLPFMDAQGLAILWDAARGHCPPALAYVPQIGGRDQVTCAVYHRDLLPSLDAWLCKGASSLQGWLRSLAPGVVAFADESRVAAGVRPQAFANLNTIDDCRSFLDDVQRPSTATRGSMRVRVLLNGHLRALARRSELELEVPGPLPVVQDVLEAVAHALEVPVARFASTAAAVGDAVVSLQHEVRSGDVVVLLPPVSGG